MADRNDLANVVKEKLLSNPNYPKPGIFADSVTLGLQRPMAGLAAGLDFWNYPGSSFGDRYRGGTSAYSSALDKQIEDAGPVSSMAQGLAGGLVMGGPSGSLLKQGAFDAGVGGVQSLAEGGSLSDAGQAAALNAMLGGMINAGAAGRSALNRRDDLIREWLAGGGR